MDAKNFEDLLFNFRWQLTILLLGIIVTLIGLLIHFNIGEDNSIEVLNEASVQDEETNIVVEVSGAVVNPGVYSLIPNSRVEDALKAAGGFKEEDTLWVSKFLNRADFLKDGQKIFIPSINQSSNESASNLTGSGGVLSSQKESQIKYININTASQSELETLWGIGPVYALKIIEQRPYSEINELVSKGVLKQNVYDKNKDLLTVY